MLDAVLELFQIPIHKDCVPLTTFITLFSWFCFERVPMEITMGTEVFLTKMKEILDGLDGCDAIMDGTIVFGRTEEHDKRLNTILEKIGLSGLKLNKQIMPLDVEGSQVVCKS